MALSLHTHHLSPTFLSAGSAPMRRYPFLPLQRVRYSTTPVAVSVSASSKPAPAAVKGKRGTKGIMTPRPVSLEMQAFIGGGVTEIPRTEVLKAVWAYIKQNNLQDPENKKIIVCDEKLKKIFAGKDRVGFLEVAGLIGHHFPKKAQD